eukprot:2717741-Amphidinium_carterae.1
MEDVQDHMPEHDDGSDSGSSEDQTVAAATGVSHALHIFIPPTPFPRSYQQRWPSLCHTKGDERLNCKYGRLDDAF